MRELIPGKDYVVRKESIEDMIAGGRFNPALEIVFADEHGTHVHKLKAGYDDRMDVRMARDSGGILVFTWNPHLGYAAFEAFKGSERLGGRFYDGIGPVLDRCGGDHVRMFAHLLYSEFKGRS